MNLLDRAREQAATAAKELRTPTPSHPALWSAETGDRPPLPPPPELALRDATVVASRVLGEARTGMSKLLDHLDPGLLADVIVRTTSLQERTNVALRARSSPYRIGGISVTATLPPQISFSIERVEPEAAGAHDPDARRPPDEEPSSLRTTGD